MVQPGKSRIEFRAVPAEVPCNHRAFKRVPKIDFDVFALGWEVLLVETNRVGDHVFAREKEPVLFVVPLPNEKRIGGSVSNLNDDATVAEGVVGLDGGSNAKDVDVVVQRVARYV